jgi:ribonuclease P protein component
MLHNELVRIVIKNDESIENPKFAVIVSNKIAKKAVVRNQIRRQTYSALEKCIIFSPKAYISVYPKKVTASYQELEKSIKDLLCLKK